MTTPNEDAADVAPVPPIAGTSKGYRLDATLLRPEDIAYFEGLAQAHGHSLPEFIARVLVLEDTEKVVTCLRCKQRQKQVGVYPDVPWRPPDDPYETKLCIRLLGNRWIEILEPGRREGKYICSACVTTNTMMIKMLVKMIAKTFPQFSPDEGFIDDLFGKAVPLRRTLGAGARPVARTPTMGASQLALPPPKKE